MVRRVARLGLVSTLGALVACGGATLPPQTARARVVPIALSEPTSCGEPKEGEERESPRRPTDLEQRMRSGLVLAKGDPDLDACRALCRRALQQGDDVVSCFHASSQVKIGCKGEACPGRDPETLRRSLFCGAEGRRAAADPVAAQAALPFVAREGDRVVVCSLR